MSPRKCSKSLDANNRKADFWKRTMKTILTRSIITWSKPNWVYSRAKVEYSNSFELLTINFYDFDFSWISSFLFHDWELIGLYTKKSKVVPKILYFLDFGMVFYLMDSFIDLVMNLVKNFVKIVQNVQNMVSGGIDVNLHCLKPINQNSSIRLDLPSCLMKFLNLFFNVDFRL